VDIEGHVQWVAARFRDADDPGWVPPGEDELREHFEPRYLAMVTVPALIERLTRDAAHFRRDLVVIEVPPHRLKGDIGGLRLQAGASEDPPYRLTGLHMYALGWQVADARTAEPSTQDTGAVPERARRVAEESFADLGLVGLLLAGAGFHGAPWVVASGWADLDTGELLRPDHLFPVKEVTQPVTATAVLRLVADGRVELDRPANDHLHTLRLDDDTVTVRELLTETGGVVTPFAHYVERFYDLPALLGERVPTGRRRGEYAPGFAGYAVLGQLVADVTGTAFPDAVAELVLRPLGMSSSGFPVRWPERDAINTYQLTDGGNFIQGSRWVSSMPGGGGLWTTGADLVRFGAGWASLLPDELARAATTPHVPTFTIGTGAGMGWLINESRQAYGHAGGGSGGSASLLVRPGTGVAVALSSRSVPVESVAARLLST
jgi:CubicO group peptidase (beta-lactamase class C family)